MSELSELDEINRLDNQREALKREADAKWYDHGDIRDEIVILFNQYRRRNTDLPDYLILDQKSFRELKSVNEQHMIVSIAGSIHYMGLIICIVQQNEPLHYVQVV